MKKTTFFRKGLALLLVLVLILGMMPTSALAANSAIKNFYATEIFGYEGKLYVTVKDDVPMRDYPVNTGDVLEYLPKGYPIEALGMYRTNKNTKWILVDTPDHDEAWIFIDNLESHQHSFIDLGYLGYDFRFCDECGHIQATHLDSYTVDYDSAHIALAALSLAPVIGNGFDFIDGLLCLVEGDEVGALMSFSSMIPIVGYGGNAAKVADQARTLKVGAEIPVNSTNGYTILATRTAENTVEITQKPDYAKLKKQMNNRYEQTGDQRFYNYPGEQDVAGHHIVAANAPDAATARSILNKVGIGINDWENGVYLCSKSATCLGGTIHAGGHSSAYYQEVNERLLKAYNNANDANKLDAVKSALDDIARDLMSGKLEL